MKAIALSTIAIFIIAVASIVILISFLTTNFPEALKQAYCSLSRSLLGFLPLPEHLRPSLPTFCKSDYVLQRVVYIESSNPDRISFEIAAHVIACWEQTGKISLNKNANCYEVVIKRVEGVVDETSVKSQLPNEYKNLMEWQAGFVDREKSLGIFYDASKKIVVVV